MDEFIVREFGIRLGRAPLDFALRVRWVLAKYLAETSVAADQSMIPVDGQWMGVQVLVPETIQ